jgi:arylformamidase
MTIYDISISISELTPIYPGDPTVRIERWESIADGNVANVSYLHLCAHTGTHIDAPSHFIDGAKGIDKIPLETLVGEARVVTIPDEIKAIEAKHILDLKLNNVTRILFKTRNSSFWNDSPLNFREDYSSLTAEGAEVLVQLGIKLVGIDYLSIEPSNTSDFQTHKILLSNGIVILEGLNLYDVPEGNYELSCLPLKLAGGMLDGAPARAILRTL